MTDGTSPPGGGAIGADLDRPKPPWPRPPVTDPIAVDRRLDPVGVTWFITSFSYLELGDRPITPLLTPLLAVFVAPLVPLLPTKVRRRMRLIQLLAAVEGALAVVTLLVPARAIDVMRSLTATTSLAVLLVVASIGISLSHGTPLRARWQRVAQVLIGTLLLGAIHTVVEATTLGSTTPPWESWPPVAQGTGLALIAVVWLSTLVIFLRTWWKTRAWVVMWARWLAPDA